jgi:hypothetical protein
MAQTKKKRRRKHRGTQGGRIDTRPARGRPRSRAEAQARARSRRGKGKGRGKQQRTVQPPTWKSAIQKGVFAAALFFGGLVLLFKEPVGTTAVLSIAMVGFYVPMAYYVDRFFYNRQLRKEEKERLARSEQRGGDQADQG